MVLIHGAGENHTRWRYQSRWLKNRGFRVAPLDLPGHGDDGGEPLSTVEEMASWVAGQIEGPAALVGHSMGGLIALELARTRPDLVDRLILSGTSTSIQVNPELQQAADEHLTEAVAMIVGWSYDPIGRLGGHPDPGIAPAILTGRLLEFELGNLGRDLRATASYTRGEEAAAGVRVPTLVIAGGVDRMVPLASVQRLAAAIEGSQFEILEKAG
ncbi:MAG TPA: alpha/beta hydrolase, partial [Acidimicrobiia bacterium]|nr:alpha/beta hydrolase [Acidimicrobiia bacterium]